MKSPLVLAVEQAERNASAWLCGADDRDALQVDSGLLDALNESELSGADSAFLAQKVDELDQGSILSTATRIDSGFALALARACARAFEGSLLDKAHAAFSTQVTGPSTPAIALPLARQGVGGEIKRHGRMIEAWAGLFLNFSSEFDRQSACDICLALRESTRPPAEFLALMDDAGGGMDALAGAFDAMPEFIAALPGLARSINERQGDDPDQACDMFSRALTFGMDPGPLDELDSMLALLACEHEARDLGEGLACGASSLKARL